MRPPAPSAAPGRMGWGRARGGYGRGAGKGGWPRRVGRGKAGGRGSLAAGAGRRAAAAQAAASSPLKRVIKGYLKRQARDDERRQADRLGLREGPAASRGGGQGGVLVRRLAKGGPPKGAGKAARGKGVARSKGGKGAGKARRRASGALALAGAPREQPARPDSEEYAPGRSVFFRSAGESASAGQLARLFETAGVVSKFSLMSGPDGRSRGRAVRLREPPRLEGRRPMRAGRGLHALGVPMTRGGGAASRRPGAASATAMPPRGRIPIPIPSAKKACGSSSRLSLPRPSASPRLLVRPPARPPPCSDAWLPSG
ncbi:unnamed protein product [Prorocentrum cordatum]|uniref:RRM domain-containing protein n=1 Tax=Prorocentrum cordatum TaxID=2364126 RepID=A0ABN9PCC7_9DINO|nr:unnamed protein product [Polarella glacialis]